VTADEFLDRHPEFDREGNRDLVEQTLAEAQVEIDEAGGAGALSTRYDAAHGYLTAHKLWVSPFGLSLRLDPSSDYKGESYYLEQYNRIWRGARSTARVSSTEPRGW
jgi:hypothetical protein